MPRKITEAVKAYKRAWEKKNRRRINARNRELYALDERRRNRPRSDAYKARRNQKSRERYKANRERILASQAEYRKNFGAVVRATKLAWIKRNRGYATAARAKWGAAKLRACPKWVDLKAIKDIYDTAAWITATTGVKHDVDHIVPLQGENVCGLHVPWNLQILNRSTNARKSNHV